MEEERRVVVFKMGTREQALTIDETKPIPSHLPERSNVIRELSSQIKLAVREGGGEVRLTEDSRLDLLEEVAATGAPRDSLPSSAVAEAAEEKHDQEDDENPSPDRHRFSSVPSASWLRTRLPRRLTRFVRRLQLPRPLRGLGNLCQHLAH